METGTYTLDPDTGRVNLNFSRPAYQALPETVRRDIKAYFRFSRTMGCWASKKAARSLDSANLSHVVRIAQAAGLTREDADEQVRTASYGERREAQIERGIDRAGRRADAADKKLAEAHRVTGEGIRMMDAIPMGQPILVGHHSEGRDRRYRARSWGKIEKGADLAREAKELREKAEGGLMHAHRMGGESVSFCQRRIEDAEKELRDLARKMTRCDEIAEAIQDGLDAGVEGDLAPYEAWAERLDAARDEALDKLGYWTERLDALGGIQHSQESMKARPPSAVLYRSTWYLFKRANAKTVTVTGWLGLPDWTWKVPYAQVAGVRYEDDPETPPEGEHVYRTPSGEAR